MSLTLQIPTVNDNLDDFDSLFQLWQKVNQDCSEVIFDFSKCWFLRPNAVAFLGGLIRLIESQGRKVTFQQHTLHKKVKRNLQQNGFMYAFCQDMAPWQGFCANLVKVIPGLSLTNWYSVRGISSI